MSDGIYTLAPVAAGTIDGRLTLAFDDTTENRAFIRLVFEAALAGDPLSFRPLVAGADLGRAARDDAMARAAAAEDRERDARERLADAERALEAERARRWGSDQLDRKPRRELMQ